MEFAVKAETHAGKVMTLRRGFPTEEAAEDHPVQMSLWKRVWVEPLEAEPARLAELPPRPWDWVTSGTVSANGLFNAYLVDANGRRIAAIWGKGREKEMIADHILSLVNGNNKGNP